ncbi:MAG: MotA/TolQ/ExbB proton channel family protein [Chthonomonadaceae bacterium]|nr:MotA/TolQ/ExbB proton channel family protein [Chthonomonadaceae bacterium]
MSGIFQFIKGGGVMMYPLILCSVLMIALIIERIISYRKAGVDGDTLLDGVKSVYDGGSEKGIMQSRALCESMPGCVSRMFSRGLKNAHRSADAIEMALEQEAANEIPLLDANLPVIKTIINIAPLLGLLGTIAGMISAFRIASEAGLSNPTAILGGVSEALISTATGITLAAVGFVFYNYFTNQSRKITEDMEFYGAELVNFLTGRID